MGSALLSRRLVFVTGKGGVGKTTVALALGLAAVRDGLRTLVADIAGDNGGTEETELAPGLFSVSVDPQGAMEEYLALKVPGAAGAMLRQSRVFHAFAMATPGMRELLCMGKIWELAQLERRTADADSFDLVIVDGPASGHGAAILRTPRTFAEVSRVGPIANQARTIAETLADPSFTAVVGVTRAEEMAVNETLELSRTLACLPEPQELAVVILNARYPDRITQTEAETLTASLDGAPAAGEAARAQIAVALGEHRRTLAQGEQARRLRDAFADRLLTLPQLFAPRLGPEQLELLAGALAQGLNA